MVTRDLWGNFFEDDADSVVVVGDNTSTQEWAKRQGHRFLHISQGLEQKPERCVLVGTTKYWYSKLSMLRYEFAASAVMWLPLGAFDGSEPSVAYGLRQLELVDWSQTANAQSEATARLTSRRVLMRDRFGRVADATIPAGTPVHEARLDIVKTGEFRSLVGSLEVETEYMSFDGPPLDCNGQLEIDCILFALSPRTLMTDSERSIASCLSREVSSGPALLTMNGARVESFKIGNREALPALVDLAGNELQDRITEVSIGLNEDLIDADWSFNSPMNEGAAGVHFGVGDGYSGVHIDFVSAAARVS